MRGVRINGHANRGRALELMIDWQNRQYRAHGVALIHKVPTEWLPLRDGAGQIRSAKVERQAAVDFLGVYRGKAIAFDAKQTSERRVRWDRVEPHQADFLTDWERRGGLSFILVGFMGTADQGRYYLVPWAWWRGRLEDYDRRSSGSRTPASVSADELAREWEIPGSPRAVLDYLAVVERLPEPENVFKEVSA